MADTYENFNYKKSMKLPESWTKATADSTTTVMNHDKGTKEYQIDPQKNPSTERKVTARIDMSANVAGQGLCPECRQPMKRVISAGIPTLSCFKDRISLPIPDEA